jgi:pyruvate dehydrogenase E2 component (dihydrolipoamide acetyltransferase)
LAAREIQVPDIGDFKNVEVIDVLVKAGDRIDAETPLLTLETEKATMDVPAPFAGVIEKLLVSKGSKVSAGTAIAILQSEGEVAAPAPAPAAAAAAKPAEPAKPAASAPAPAAAAAPASAPAAPAAAAEPVEVRVPDIGNFKDVEVIDVLVKAGETIAVDTPLLTLETEKATMDVPAPIAGVIEKLLISKGQRVSAGSVVATVRAASAPAAAAAPAPAPAAPPTAAAKSATAPVAAAPAAKTPAPAGAPPAGLINEAGFATAHASPSVRQFARELGVDLARVKGSGHKGRITQEDIKAFVKALLQGGGAAAGAGSALPRVPIVDFAQFGPIEIKPLNRIQRISGPRVHASWVNLPHVTQFDQADITELEEARRWLKARAVAEGVRLTPLAFIIRACVRVLKQLPRFNASLDATAENLVLKQYCHVGFAADTPNGLMVPVIRDADKKDVFELARALGELSEKARKGRLSGAEMQGGCFTISSLGGIGGTAFTPIINAPEVAILGVSKSSMQPVYKDSAFVPRMLLPLALSYDHRVIDGADGARFVTALTKELQNVDGLLEAVK